MKRTALISASATALLVVALAGPAFAADSSAAMVQHMRLTQNGNPGMDRMMELMDAGNAGMQQMMDAAPFQMPPIHP